jgi:hypothetical protein
MTPVVVLRVKPAGSAGCTEYDATKPPLLDGRLAVMAVPTV